MQYLFLSACTISHGICQQNLRRGLCLDRSNCRDSTYDFWRRLNKDFNILLAPMSDQSNPYVSATHRFPSRHKLILIILLVAVTCIEVGQRCLSDFLGMECTVSSPFPNYWTSYSASWTAIRTQSTRAYASNGRNWRYQPCGQMSTICTVCLAFWFL